MPSLLLKLTQNKPKMAEEITIIRGDTSKKVVNIKAVMHMIRCGKISNEGGHEIFSVVLKEPDLTDCVMDILDLELSEQETVAKVEKLL